ncbi:hypothetical protein Ocin01_14672 [Orchesella cincta]|uniref:Uncharacterized protein n=1 Tax=Orchesella cincta TaxID=48709 RepID=A0A1D2MG87_ORCCI|nr:hypothetical protein Ocin01_14672 [Orchesella cincta]
MDYIQPNQATLKFLPLLTPHREDKLLQSLLQLIVQRGQRMHVMQEEKERASQFSLYSIQRKKPLYIVDALALYSPRLWIRKNKKTSEQATKERSREAKKIWMQLKPTS